MRRRKYSLTILSALIAVLAILPTSPSSIYQLTMRRPNPKKSNYYRPPVPNELSLRDFPKEVRKNYVSPHKVSDDEVPSTVLSESTKVSCDSPKASSDRPKVSNDASPNNGSNNAAHVPDCYTYRYQVSDAESGVFRDHMEFRNSGGMIHGELSIVRDEVKIDIKYKGLPSKGWEASVEQAPGLPLLAPMAPAIPFMDKANHGLQGSASQGMLPPTQVDRKWPFLRLADRQLPSFGQTDPRFPSFELSDRRLPSVGLAKSRQRLQGLADSRFSSLLATPRSEHSNLEAVSHHKALHSYQDLNELEERLRLFYHNNHVHLDTKNSNGK